MALSFSMKRLWSTVSKALVTSKNRLPTSKPRSRARCQSLKLWSSEVAVQWRGRKPDQREYSSRASLLASPFCHSTVTWPPFSHVYTAAVYHERIGWKLLILDAYKGHWSWQTTDIYKIEDTDWDIHSYIQPPWHNEVWCDQDPWVGSTGRGTFENGL